MSIQSLCTSNSSRTGGFRIVGISEDKGADEYEDFLRSFNLDDLGDKGVGVCLVFS